MWLTVIFKRFKRSVFFQLSTIARDNDPGNIGMRQIGPDFNKRIYRFILYLYIYI
jgi:hypothetical protein